MEDNKYNKLFHIARSHIYKYREEEFTLVSGNKSHHYFNCKGVTMHPEYSRLLAEVIHHCLILKNNISIPELIGGLTLGADPIAFALSHFYLDIKKLVFPVIVRKESKKHGTAKQIEGLIGNCKNMILIDDVITTAGSSISALNVLRNKKIEIDYCIAIVDRQEGGKEALKKEGVELLSVFKKSDFHNSDND